MANHGRDGSVSAPFRSVTNINISPIEIESGGYNASNYPVTSIPALATRVCIPMHFHCQDTEIPFSGRWRTLSPHESNRGILVGPFCRVYVDSPSHRRTCLPIDASTSCFHVLARFSSYHTCEVARCWVRVSNLLCCEGRGLSNIMLAGYGTTQSRNYRGSANGWTATKTITSTTHTLSTAWAIRTQWEWCPKAWHRVSYPFRETPIPL